MCYLFHTQGKSSANPVKLFYFEVSPSPIIKGSECHIGLVALTGITCISFTVLEILSFVQMKKLKEAILQC